MTGISTNVTSVEIDNPHATVIPIYRHISAPSPVPIAIGNIPSTVVKVVINTGRKHDFPAATVASILPNPRSRPNLV